ncbi:hypothetical protein D9M72_302710 [compost metagenome]
MGIDRRDQLLAVGDDSLVGCAQVLASTVLDRALRFDCPLVMDVDVVAHARVGLRALLVGVEVIVIALVLTRPVVRQFVQRQALFAHLLLVDRRGEAGEDGVPVAAGVVDGHMPLRDRHLRAHWDNEGLREHHVGHAHMPVAVAEFAQRGQAHAIVGRRDADVRAVVLSQHLRDRHRRIGRGAAELLAVAFRDIVILEEAV